MASRTASPPDALAVSAVLDNHAFPQEPVQDKISAYYSLIFPNFTYYLQTLEVTIGRRCIPNSTASTSDQVQVDVDLGPLKSVSRLHAKIEYEEEEERFVLVVLGRNGAWVDGIWSARGSKVPLGERSQIQIASRTFHFVLPPPPVPEDSPSPSSHTSSPRPRSPSVDITSLSPPSSVPSFSPPPPVTSPPLKAPPLPDPPQLLRANATGKGKQVAGKKRKAGEVEPAKFRPKPEEMPPKPHFTYAQLCYRAIKALGGRATLQDIIGWMIDNYDWYRLNVGAGWEKSVRHNLSSNRAFRKVERSAGERGKGYYWTVEPEYEHTFQEQEARALIALSTGGKDGKTKKGKGIARGDGKSAPPPLMTSTPLVFKSPASTTPAPAPSAAPNTSITVKAEPRAAVKAEPLPAPQIPSVSQQPHAAAPATASHTSTAVPPISPVPPTTVTSSPLAPTPSAPSMSPPATSTELTSTHPPNSAIPPIPASVILPIVVGPGPPSHPAFSASSASSAVPHLGAPPIVLHENQLILNPTIFSHLTPEQLRGLEALGAQKALEVLQKHIVRFLKEKIRTEAAARGRGRGRAKRGRGGAVRVGKDEAGVSGAKTEAGTEGEAKENASTTSPFTAAPLVSGKSQESQSTPTAALTPAPAPNPPPPLSTDVPMNGVEGPPSPILIVDDDEPLEGPTAKRRRLDVQEGQMQAVSV